MGENDLSSRIEKALTQSRWGTFDSLLRSQFEERNAPVNRRSVQQGGRAATVCYITFGLFDLWLFPDVGLQSASIRILVGLLSLLVVEWQLARRVDLRIINLTCATSLVMAAWAWIQVAKFTAYQENFALFLVFGTVFVVSSSLFFRFRLSVSAVCSTAITLLLCVAVAAATVPFGTKLVLVAYFLIFLWFALYLSWQLTLERYATFLNETRARLNERAVREKGRQLALIANTDHLTGLRNRRAVVNEYADYRKRWLSDGRPIGVLLIDVDHFKSFNDRYGHQAGDNCLIAVALTLDQAAAEFRAIVGRYGGEEFVAFCHVEDEDTLLRFAEHLRRAVEALDVQQPERADGIGIVTVSIGASMTRAGTSPDLERMSSEADRALYHAKADGRNRSYRFDPDAPEVEDSEQGLAELLARAIADDRLSVAYQPIVGTGTGRVCAIETLMRLRDDSGTPVSPAVFIPIAERTGLIGELGRWVLRQACTDILLRGVADRVSVNVSAVQLRAPGFPLYVARLLGELQVPPGSLALEITEGIDISLDANILDAIRSLKALGVQIWLDDFGTGYAGLQWLQTITFDVVKVDQSFLHRIDTEEGRLFLQDVLLLLRNRDLQVVVEGVETDEQLAFLREGGVAMAQGYFLGRPGSVDAMVAEMPDRHPAGHPAIDPIAADEACPRGAGEPPAPT